MTIVELRDRLTQIIEDNEKRGWGERNTSRVMVEHEVGKRVTEYLPVKYAHGAWYGLLHGHGLGIEGERENYFQLMVTEPVARYGGRRSK